MNNIKIVYLLESIDLEKLTGVLKMKNEFPKNGPWTTINVGLHKLLAYRIANNKLDGLSKPDSYVGTKFTSTVNSKEFSENPFKLIKFSPKGKSDVPVNYRLELVSQRFTPFEEVVDALGNKSNIIRKWRTTHPKYYTRFVEYQVENMLSSLKVSIVIP